ncbi:hypothetical protein PH552_05655 [Rhizobium sp. CNPSo 3968]|uniref:hypothetical protein n=1 Tax=Rhizobium sp. CNPSo 3968 TaxID=3021408 RepID=UPI00254C4AE2|nr:hypothetical protein [Rhizobium sp. CNPSo 3968]MDK4718829.1 hypothetical protein [Rhizobium sp. CNPSo 3968]
MDDYRVPHIAGGIRLKAEPAKMACNHRANLGLMLANAGHKDKTFQSAKRYRHWIDFPAIRSAKSSSACFARALSPFNKTRVSALMSATPSGPEG